jgi:hypothetical protein
MITGKEKADAGIFTVGDTVKLAVVDQDRDSLNGRCCMRSLTHLFRGCHVVISAPAYSLAPLPTSCFSYHIQT